MSADLASGALAGRARRQRVRSRVLRVGVCVTTVVGLVACGGSEAVGCIDAVQFDGESYIDIDVVADYRGPMNISEPQLGELALVTTKALCGGALNDGEATTLPAGSELFFVNGEQDLLGRITAGGVRLYVASSEYGVAFVMSP